jgi:GAT domain
MSQGPSQPAQPGNHFARQHRQPRALPPPDELAARIEEAKTTAKLLSQTVQSTPSTEMPNNDLIKEFADRASSASRSIQGYIHSTNPAPDEDTLLTLIETNDQLSIAMSKHQRALLQARRTMSSSPPAMQQQQADQVNYAAPQGPPPGAMGVMKPQDNFYAPPHGAMAVANTQDNVYAPPRSPPERAPDHIYAPPSNAPPQRAPLAQQEQQPPQRNQTRHYDVPENPFADEARQQASPQQSYGLFGRLNQAGPPPGRDQQVPQPEPLQPRAQNQMPTYQSTPSYAYRQDSATNNLTMHGESHPPDQQDISDVQQRMANMRT